MPLPLLEEAKKPEWHDGVLLLPCGDSTCDLVDRSDGNVEIGYSFAL